MVFWVVGFGWVTDSSQSVGLDSLSVFSLRQQSPCPIPVLQTGGGVEWDRRAASTNLFPSAVWLISPVGVQLLPAYGMYPPHPSEEIFVRDHGFCRVMGNVAHRHGQHPDLMQLIKGVAGWSVGWLFEWFNYAHTRKLYHCMGKLRLW